jgi:integrase
MTTETNIIANPGKMDLTISIEKVKGELPKYWNREHINTTIDTITNTKHKMLITFLWFTGCRISEIVQLKKRDIDMQNYLITIRWLKNRKYQTRNIPMHPLLRNQLSYYLATLNLDDVLFGLSRQRSWQIVQKYFDGHPHQLRHSFAVNWLKCGGTIVELSKMLGHSDIKVTMVYLSIVPQDVGKELLKIQF